MPFPYKHFKHCPACGEALGDVTEKRMVCAACGFKYFFNPTIGLAGFLENEKGEILLIERGKDPAKGKLAPPGGFADVKETAEEALSREVREETGLEVDGWRYLTSEVNLYTYGDITYPVLDFFFTARVESGRELDLCPTETSGAKWIHKDSIDPDALAFPSMQAAFREYLDKSR